MNEEDGLTGFTEVVVGVIGRPHGIKGEVSIDLRTDEPDRRFATGTVLRSESGPCTVASLRWHKGRLLVKFDQLADRTAAEAARGMTLTLELSADELPTEPGEFYDRQLVGLTVLDAAGLRRGTVAAVLHLPAQDLLEVDTGDDRRMVPFVAALVPIVDLAAGRVQLADVTGLLSDPDEDNPGEEHPDQSDPDQNDQRERTRPQR